MLRPFATARALFPRAYRAACLVRGTCGAASESVAVSGVRVPLPPELLPGAGKGKRVVVGVSGGVDSSVSALLLKNAGYDVVGVFMRNWDEKDEGGSGTRCTANEDMRSAKIACDAIGIPLDVVSFVRDYWLDVFEPMLRTFADGMTPNPDILCNAHIKFTRFFDHAVNKLGADYVATGHYARVRRRSDGPPQLLRAVDVDKDQTFFLCWVPGASLERALFPVGHLEKPVVRLLARHSGLVHAAERPESMGICFIGKRSFSDFISEYIPDKPGEFVTLDGRVVGTHRGLHHFTLGQRSRLSGFSRPVYVAWKVVQTNRVIVVEGSDHPLMRSATFTTTAPVWVNPSDVSSVLVRKERAVGDGSGGGAVFGAAEHTRLAMRFRHLAPLMPCRVSLLEGDEGGLLVWTDAPLASLTPGQVAVLYDGDVCLGGATIADIVEPEIDGRLRPWSEVVREHMDRVRAEAIANMSKRQRRRLEDEATSGL